MKKRIIEVETLLVTRPSISARFLMSMRGRIHSKPHQIPLPIFASIEADQPDPEKVDFSMTWDLELAKKAFAALNESGKSRTAFAREHGFGRDRFRNWEERVNA